MNSSDFGGEGWSECWGCLVWHACKKEVASSVFLLKKVFRKWMFFVAPFFNASNRIAIQKNVCLGRYTGSIIPMMIYSVCVWIQRNVVENMHYSHYMPPSSSLFSRNVFFLRWSEWEKQWLFFIRWRPTQRSVLRHWFPCTVRLVK